MPRYLSILVVSEVGRFSAVVLDELTAEGFQAYTGDGGWFRREREWFLNNSVVIGDSQVAGLLDELRGRGVELIKEDFLSEVTYGS